MEACVVICRTSKLKAPRNKILFINAVNEVTFAPDEVRALFRALSGRFSGEKSEDVVLEGRAT